MKEQIDKMKDLLGSDNNDNDKYCVDVAKLMDRDDYADLNLIPFHEMTPAIEKWETYQKEKYPRDELKKHKGNVGVICGSISNNLVVLSFQWRENKEESLKDALEKIREIKPDLRTTYAEKNDSKKFFNLFYYVNDCSFNTAKKWISIKDDFTSILSSFKVYGDGDPCRLTESINKLEIHSISNEDLMNIISIFGNINEKQEDISIIVKESEDTKYEVISDIRGLILRKTTVKFSEAKGDYYTKPFNTTIINEPFKLIAIYCDQNQERFYEIRIGEEIICFDKKDLLDYIENKRNCAFVSGKVLKECVSAILFEYEKKYKLKPKEIFPTLGVFLDENDNLIVVTSDNNKTKIYGVNAYQKRTIEKCKKRGFDKNGDMIKAFYDLMHYNTYPENIRLVSFGHTLIVNFFNVLRNDIDVFFYHHWITPNKSVGKTALWKMVYAELFGIELKSNDDIDSIARFSENCTDTTSCMPIDDIDKIDEKVLTQMKVAGTTLKAKERMTKDQKTNIQETYRAFSGTANSDKFLAGDENEAFRGRCMLSTEYTIIESFELLKELELIKDKIKEGKVFGYYLLNKALKFVNKQIPDTTISSHQKLKQIIRNNKEKLRVYFEKRVLLDDPRRLTIYALLYTGWEMWNFAFQEANLKESVLLKDILNFKENDKLLHLIETYEKTGLEITLDDMRNVLEFYDREKDTKDIIKYENKEGKKIVSTIFINAYDKWAKIHGYSVLEKLPVLGNMLSKIMKEKIVPMAIRGRPVESGDSVPCKEPIRGLIFDEKKLYEKIGKKTAYNSIKERLIEIKEDNNGEPLYLDGVKQILKTEFDIDVIEYVLNEMTEKKFVSIEENKIILN